MRVAGVEREVRQAIHLAKHVRARAEAVVVAEQAYVGHTEAFQLAAHPFKLFRCAEVREVAAVHHEIHVAPRVDGINAGMRLVVPPLSVADEHEAQARAPCAVRLYPSHVARIDAGRAVEARVVGMVVYDAAPREQQCEADGRGRHDKLSDCLHFDRGRERAPARKVAVRM